MAERFVDSNPDTAIHQLWVPGQVAEHLEPRVPTSRYMGSLSVSGCDQAQTNSELSSTGSGAKQLSEIFFTLLFLNDAIFQA